MCAILAEGSCELPAEVFDSLFHIRQGILLEPDRADNARVERLEDVPLLHRPGPDEPELPEAVHHPRRLHHVEAPLLRDLVALRRVGLAHEEPRLVPEGVPVEGPPHHLHHLPQLPPVGLHQVPVDGDADPLEAAGEQGPPILAVVRPRSGGGGIVGDVEKWCVLCGGGDGCCCLGGKSFVHNDTVGEALDAEESVFFVIVEADFLLNFKSNFNIIWI